MVREGDTCPTSGVGKVHPFSYRVDKGLVEAPHWTGGKETGLRRKVEVSPAWSSYLSNPPARQSHAALGIDEVPAEFLD